MKKFLRNVFVPFAGMLLLTFALTTKANAQAQPVVTTDQSDYSSGTTVSIAGSGFEPDEMVMLQVLHSPDASGDNDPTYQEWTVQADTSGNITSTWITPSDQKVQGSTTGFVNSIWAIIRRFTDRPDIYYKN